MNPYELGAELALKTADVYPEAYNAAGAAGAIGGGAAGAAGGAALGNYVAQQIGRQTRQKHLLMPIPGTGFGERFFSASPGPVVGETLGALAGGAVGAGLGYHGGHLAALNHGGAPHRLANEQGQFDPRLLAYLNQG